MSYVRLVYVHRGLTWKNIDFTLWECAIDRKLQIFTLCIIMVSRQKGPTPRRFSSDNIVHLDKPHVGELLTFFLDISCNSSCKHLAIISIYIFFL